MLLVTEISKPYCSVSLLFLCCPSEANQKGSVPCSNGSPVPHTRAAKVPVAVRDPGPGDPMSIPGAQEDAQPALHLSAGCRVPDLHL